MTPTQSTDAVATPLLELRDLSIDAGSEQLTVVDRVSFSIDPGEIVALIGESGAGKTMIGTAIMGLLNPPMRLAGGEIRYCGQRIDNLSHEAMRSLRGREIATIFQDPMTALNPLFTIGDQLIETLRQHAPIDRGEAHARAVALLNDVGIVGAQKRLHSYPHEFSGGMRQRVVIALALAGNPRLLIADEPTTALDVSIQAQIVDLLKRLAATRKTAILLITHDVGVVASAATRLAVMYAGRLVEVGSTTSVIAKAKHPYSLGLMGSVPAIGVKRRRLRQIDGAMPAPGRIPEGCSFAPRCVFAEPDCRAAKPVLELHDEHLVACRRAGNLGAASIATDDGVAPPPATQWRTAAPDQPLLEVTNLSRRFEVSPPLLNRIVERRGREYLNAVDEVGFTLLQGSTMGLVGESGCGKSTLARCISGLIAPTGGEILLGGKPLTKLSDRRVGGENGVPVQMIFQDPYGSLNPRWTVAQTIGDAVKSFDAAADRAEVTRRIDIALRAVGLSHREASRYPHEFSGGQRQRIAIARALASRPDLLICDEPTSALDVSVQAQVLNLMRDLQDEFELTYLFISHNLAVIAFMADFVGVMYVGRIVELRSAAALFERPLHPYTQLLIDAVPRLSGAPTGRSGVAVEIANPLHRPNGCSFHPRCPMANARCRSESPRLLPAEGGHVACHAVEENRL